MYAYRVGRDCLKRAVLCYTFGRWEFERSKKHRMELRKYTRLTWCLLPIWPISSFSGSSEVFIAAFYRRSQGWTERYRKPCTARPFFRRNSDPLLDFPLATPFSSNSNGFCFPTGSSWLSSAPLPWSQRLSFNIIFFHLEICGAKR